MHSSAGSTNEPTDIDACSGNIAARLRQVAARQPGQLSMARPLGRYAPGRQREYATMTFADIELQTSSIAAGLQQMGVQPGQRIVMLVRFGVDFISLVFALLQVGAFVVFIAPGM